MGVWKVLRETKGQATLEGNHDNPVSNTHQADTYQWRKTSKGVGAGSWEQLKLLKLLQAKAKWAINDWPL